MSQIQELEPAAKLAEGCFLRFFIDHSKPEDSIDHAWTEASYDGKADSDLLEVGAHWHKYHDEYMQVLEGRMSFTLEGKTTVLSAGDPALKLPRGHVHSAICFKGERTTVKERTDPAGDFKQLFFRDLLQSGKPGFWIAMRAFYDGDTYVSLPGNVKIVDQVVSAASIPQLRIEVSDANA